MCSCMQREKLCWYTDFIGVRDVCIGVFVDVGRMFVRVYVMCVCVGGGLCSGVT